MTPRSRASIAAGMLIVATGCTLIGTQTARAVSATPPESTATDCRSLTTSYTPRQLRVAYGRPCPQGPGKVVR
jgi:hypothetical protein